MQENVDRNSKNCENGENVEHQLEKTCNAYNSLQTGPICMF